MREAGRLKTVWSPARLAGWLYALLVAGFLLAPIAMVVASSFTSNSFITFPPEGFSLRWYQAILERGQFAAALRLSLVLACSTGAVSGILGLLAGLGLYRARFIGRDLVVQFLNMPLIVPAVVLGIALLQWYARIGLFAGFARLLVAHVVITVPFVVRLVMAGLTGSDPALERAAAGLGAGPLRILLRVTLPRIRGPLLAGVIFAFVVSLDDTGLAVFLVSGSTATLPVQIFNYISFNFDPVITAVGSVMVYLALIAVVAIDRVGALGRVLAVEADAYVHNQNG
jgi:putative spermidine/putrescine transport system permease protein